MTGRPSGTLCKHETSRLVQIHYWLRINSAKLLNKKISLDKTQDMLKPLCIADKRRVDKAKTRGKKSLLTSQPLSVFLMPRKHTAKPLGLTDDLSFFGRRKKQSHLLVYTQVLNMLTKCHFSLYLEKQDKWK